MGKAIKFVQGNEACVEAALYAGSVEAAIRQVDVALDRLCRALGVRAA